MTRLITSGFEIPNWPYPFGFGTENIVWESTGSRSGAYHISISGGVLSEKTAYFACPGTNTELYIRFGWKCSTNAYQDFLRINSDVTSNLFRLYFDKDTGRIALIANGNTVWTSPIYTNNTWYLIELHVKIDDAGVAELRVDGVDVASYSGDTKPGADTKIDEIYIVCQHSDTSNHYDDFAINDVNGTEDNSWCGDGKIIALRPDAAGDSTQWTPSAGSNYECVDEVTPDSDTTYVKAETDAYVDLYNVASPGLPSGATITRVWVQSVARKETASATQIKVGLKSGTTEAWSGAEDLLISYDMIYGPEYTVNPDDSAAWEESDLNSLQIGIKSVMS